ncbi:hypothetical protein ACFOUP_10310 [Belliella kenyensis]|uniref:SPW repeat-containing protein n=1 Tax=Belliella kenyensis TaxID=1472724 RepID=A0ABV8ELK9_9BACT|nr:hypothetical protein [Belliella kenyensis]MCH7403859.1 hypothetical protein [Belliella kenyensis]MDN3604880.1 hypothetical protein [Belliella kenyensis]
MLNIIQRRNLEIPLIIMGVLVLTSFLPLIQILIMTLNGAIIYPIYTIVDNDDIVSRYILITDSLMSLLGLIFFYVSFKKSWRIFSAIFTVLFLLPLMVLIFGFIETDVYFLQNLIAGLAVGLILLFVALLKKFPASK